MYVYVAVALLSAFLAGAGTWQVQDWRYASKEADRLEQVREDRMRSEKNIDTAAVGHEKDKVQIRTVTKTVTKEVERIVREPFYVATDAPACFDADGLRQLQAAIAPAQPASEPARKLPRSGAAR
jgi:hypothetical protein